MLVVAEDQQGGDCSAMKCGNVSISFPFWLTGEVTGRSCGFPPYQDFDVTCLDNTSLVLRSSIPFHKAFKILNISYEEHSLYAVDLGKLDVLQACDSCQAPVYNTSVKLNRLFMIAPVNLNLILYNCTEEAVAAARLDRELVQTRLRCRNEWEVLIRVGVPHDATGNYAGYALEGCDAIVVPVLGSSGEMNASNYKQLISEGFLLTWNPPTQPTLLPRKFTRRIIF